MCTTLVLCNCVPNHGLVIIKLCKNFVVKNSTKVDEDIICKGISSHGSTFYFDYKKSNLKINITYKDEKVYVQRSLSKTIDPDG